MFKSQQYSKHYRITLKYETGKHNSKSIRDVTTQHIQTHLQLHIPPPLLNILRFKMQLTHSHRITELNNSLSLSSPCIVWYDSDHLFSLSNCSSRTYCHNCLFRSDFIRCFNELCVYFKGVLQCSAVSLKDLSKLFK